MELQRSLPEFERENIALFAISYDSVEVLAAFAQKHGVTYPLLADEGSRVIRELGLLNEHVFEHHAFYGIPARDSVRGVPYPGTFLLDKHGVVQEKRFLDSYRERETGVAILERGFGMSSAIHGTDTQATGPGIAVRAHLDSDIYHAFQRLRLTVELTVDSGLHVYGAPVADGYVPLTVEIGSLPGLDIGPVDMPAPHPFRVEGLDESFLVHEGTVVLSLPLTFTENLGHQVISVAIRYQACSAVDCLPPSTLELRLPVEYQTNVDSDR